MKYFLIAGEASGDLHASSLMKELKTIDTDATFYFLGGDLMKEQGGELIQHYKNMAFMGFLNVIKNIGKIKKNFDLCTSAIKSIKPDVIILIDYPGFNLKVAKYVKTKLNIPIYYYIAPKLWAWKEYRISAIKKYVDKMFVIFPFEVEYFDKIGYKVEYVGNPIANNIANFENNNTCLERSSRKRYISLLCGSRKQEIAKCLPVMVKMKKHFKEFEFVVAGAPGIEKEFYKQFLPPDIKVVHNKTYEIVKNSEMAIVNSGTATLETALLNTPQIVVYHVIGGALVPYLKKLFIHTKYISLVNIVAGKEVVKELITPYFNEENLKLEVEKIILEKINRDKIINGYKQIRLNLGNLEASKNTANQILESLLISGNVKQG